MSVRSFDPAVRQRTLEAIERIVRAEAQASGAERAPDVEVFYGFPAVVNDERAVARTMPALHAVVGPERVFDPVLVTGSEDVGVLATAAGAPWVYWLLGGADPGHFSGLGGREDLLAKVAEQPSNHSPLYAPVIEPTLSTGVDALVSATRTWLPSSGR